MTDELPPVLFITDLCRLLRCSRTTIEKQRREHGNLPPEMRAIDKRPRWARETVLAWMAQTDVATRFRAARGGR